MIPTILLLTYVNFVTIELILILSGKSMFEAKPVKKFEL
jgi:hypothetical protein